MSELQNQVIKITDILGRIVYRRQSNSTTEKIAFSFSKGIYFITVINPENSSNVIFKILVQ